LNGRAVFSQEARNTFEADAAKRRAIRFYRLKDAAGKPVLNAYLFAVNDGSDPATYQDFVGIIRNVRPVMNAK
jgi:hypothetical protein